MVDGGGETGGEGKSTDENEFTDESSLEEEEAPESESDWTEEEFNDECRELDDDSRGRGKTSLEVDEVFEMSLSEEEDSAW